MTEPIDLGEITEPMILFGGAYSNLEATQALLKEAEERNVAPKYHLYR